MTPEEKEQVCKDFKEIIQWAQDNLTGELREHLIGCLGDRVIEIQDGEWDEE